MQTIKRILFLLSIQERKYFIILIGMVILMALIDMIGVASIMPLVAVLTKPELVKTNDYLNYIFEFLSMFGVKTVDEFFYYLVLIVFLVLVLSLSFKALTSYMQIKFVQNCHFAISKRLAESYLKQPYSWFLGKNSSDLGKSILSEVGMVVDNGLKPLLSVITHITLIIAMTFLLLIIDPILIITVIAILGVLYGLVYYIIRNFLSRIGKERVNANRMRYKNISEAFGAVKEIKLGNLEQIYLEKFSTPAQTFLGTKPPQKF